MSQRSTAARFAARSVVAIEQTQAEIVSLLVRHGATARAVGVDDGAGKATVMFAMADRRMRIDVAVHPSPPAPVPSRGWRWSDAEKRRWTEAQREQQARSAWRGILLLLRAKLESIAGGYSTVEHEFLADVVLPGGGRVGEMIGEAVRKAYLTGATPKLLQDGSDTQGPAT